MSNKVVRPKGLKQYHKGPGKTKRPASPKRELTTAKHKVRGGAKSGASMPGFMHKGKKIYG